MSDSSSSTSTALVAIVAVAVVGLLVWFFAFQGGTPADAVPADVDIDVSLPSSE